MLTVVVMVELVVAAVVKWWCYQQQQQQQQQQWLANIGAWIIANTILGFLIVAIVYYTPTPYSND